MSDEAQYHILENVSYGILKMRLELDWHFLQMFPFNSSLSTTGLGLGFFFGGGRLFNK